MAIAASPSIPQRRGEARLSPATVLAAVPLTRRPQLPAGTSSIGSAARQAAQSCASWGNSRSGSRLAGQEKKRTVCSFEYFGRHGAKGKSIASPRAYAHDQQIVLSGLCGLENCIWRITVGANLALDCDSVVFADFHDLTNDGVGVIMGSQREPEPLTPSNRQRGRARNV